MGSKNKRYKYVRSWMIKGIVIDQDGGKPVGRGPYHNIKHVDWCIRNFAKAMKVKFPGATHINFYDFKGNYLFQHRYEIEKQVHIKQRKEPLPYYDCSFSLTGESRLYNEIVFSIY